MIYAEILAGGNGGRFGKTNKPKQFLILGDKPIIIHTVEQFLINDNIDNIIISVQKEWIPFTEDILQKYIGKNEIDIIEAASTRNNSIISSFVFIDEKYGIDDEDVIVVHDAVRPFITQRIIDENVDLAIEYQGVDTIVGATDTIVESIDGKLINNVPNRKYMYQGQTPQSFNIRKFQRVYENLTDEEKKILTDSCKIFILKQEDVAFVIGEIYNIKITTPYDLKIANAILETGSND